MESRTDSKSPRAQDSSINHRGEFQMVTVYKLECGATGEVYIGCTAGKLGKRMREHRSLLKAGKHSSRLQEAWNEHAGTFQMKPLEVLPETAGVIEKRERELAWLRHFQSQGLLLNDHVISFQPPPGHAAKGVATRKANGNRHITEESNRKRSLAQLGKPKGHGAKISATKRAKREKLLMT
jgi:GIY-YIG catalytic domain